jgi:hypothetical protein
MAAAFSAKMTSPPIVPSTVVPRTVRASQKGAIPKTVPKTPNMKPRTPTTIPSVEYA